MEYADLIALLILLLAMPIAGQVARWLDGTWSDVGEGALAFVAALVPSALLAGVWNLRMNIRLYSEDWGQVVAFDFALITVPFCLAISFLWAMRTVRRARGERGE